MVGAKPSHVTKKDPRIVDRQTPQCDEEIGRGSKMGAANLTRRSVASSGWKKFGEKALDSP